jgi:hypothetical protein
VSHYVRYHVHILTTTRIKMTKAERCSNNVKRNNTLGTDDYTHIHCGLELESVRVEQDFAKKTTRYYFDDESIIEQRGYKFYTM